MIEDAEVGVGDRMRVLTVLSSSNQLYSGIGRAVFATADALRDRVEQEFAIDDREPKNVAILNAFAGPRGMPVHLGRGRKRPEALDYGNEDLGELLRDPGRWDAIECVCWANGDTNRAVLDAIGPSPLIFTPHHQPPWSVPMGPGQEAFTDAVYSAMLSRSDLVLCDSPWERTELRRIYGGLGQARVVPLGCDFAGFRPGPEARPPRLLFVGDLAEPRKRFDRVVALMERLLPAHPDLRLVVIGHRSDSDLGVLPARVRRACLPMGYVDEPTLRAAYASSLGLVLLSDFEAFGIPILEALASGTPVFLGRLGPTESLFGDCRGAHFCPLDDPGETAAIVGRVLREPAKALRLAIGDVPRLQSRFDWGSLAREKWAAMSAAWAWRCRWSWCA